MIALVTGAASSGKSAYAECLAMQYGSKRAYLATMPVFGPEDEARVDKHRAQRAGKGFETVEWGDGEMCAPRIQADVILLEDVGNLVARLMYVAQGSTLGKEGVVSLALDAIDVLAMQCSQLVVVGNEVGSDGMRYPVETQAYIEALGAVCCAVAARSELVVECVAGIAQVVKGEV